MRCWHLLLGPFTMRSQLLLDTFLSSCRDSLGVEPNYWTVIGYWYDLVERILALIPNKSMRH